MTWADIVKEQCALIREFEMRIPRALAEAFALEDVKAVFDKRGCNAS